MKYVITPRELMDKGIWMDYCEATGTNEWAVNEGLMESDEELTLTQEQAEKIGLVPRKGGYGS